MNNKTKTIAKGASAGAIIGSLALGSIIIPCAIWSKDHDWNAVGLVITYGATLGATFGGCSAWVWRLVFREDEHE